MFPTGIGEAIPELTIALLPEYRGRGIGGKLLDHALSAAKSRFPAVSLSVSDLIQLCGFTSVLGLFQWARQKRV
jgi:GNAT superfamily N-acetyltransferase